MMVGMRAFQPAYIEIVEAAWREVRVRSVVAIHGWSSSMNEISSGSVGASSSSSCCRGGEAALAIPLGDGSDV